MLDLKELFCTHIEHVNNSILEVLFRMKLDYVIIGSGTRQFYFNDDITIPFKVNPYFGYFVPKVEGPNCFVIVSRIEQKPHLYYHTPEDYWHKAEPLPDCPRYDSVGSYEATINSNRQSFFDFRLRQEGDCGLST